MRPAVLQLQVVPQHLQVVGDATWSQSDLRERAAQAAPHGLFTAAPTAPEAATMWLSCCCVLAARLWAPADSPQALFGHPALVPGGPVHRPGHWAGRSPGS